VNNQSDNFILKDLKFTPITKQELLNHAHAKGVFTTLKVVKGVPIDIDKHLQRLQHDAQLVGINLLELDLLRSTLLHFLEARDNNECVLKIVLTSKQLNSKNQKIQLCIQFRPYTAWPQTLKLKICKNPLPRNDKIAGLKTLDRENIEMASREFQNNPEFNGGLLLDTEQSVIESTIANIFWYNDYTFYTPSLKFAGVNGICRKNIIENLTKNNDKIVIDNFNISDLLNAHHAWLCNSVRGIKSIAFIENKSFSLDDSITHKLLN